ncbi:MAG: DUF421 domain-containing protein [Clostridiales bacterium]|nr:DUF421 domain-containing protein [Clostridiales bacterium]MCF8022909.1 DUF421 domain-containing protein [Clostridiales bacterium]
MSPYIQILFRALGAFVIVLLITRMLGKSQVKQLTVTDFINAVVVGSIASELVIDLKQSSLYFGFGMIFFGLLSIIAEWISLKYRPARKILEGEPAIVIHNGKILEDNMKKILYNLDNLTMQLREQGVFDIGEVEFAVAEPDGSLSVLPKSSTRPVTPSDLNLSTNYQGIASELIMDGKIIEQNLIQNNLDKEWLFRELEKQSIKKVSDVKYATLNTDGSLYVDVKHDKLDHHTDPTDKISNKK